MIVPTHRTLREWFNYRYDLNNLQSLQTAEDFKQFVTAINFDINVPLEHSKWLNEQPAQYAAENPSFSLTLEQFVPWYCELLQSRMVIAQ